MAFSQSGYTGAISTNYQGKRAKDIASAESKLKQIDVQEFQFEERQKFEGKVKDASKGGKWGTSIGSIGAGIAVGALGVAAAPAALIVGGAALAGGMIGSHKGKKELADSKWYKSDARDAKSAINKQIYADSIMAGITAGAGAKSAKLKGGETVLGEEVVEEASGDAIEQAITDKGVETTTGQINWQIGDIRRTKDGVATWDGTNWMNTITEESTPTNLVKMDDNLTKMLKEKGMYNYDEANAQFLADQKAFGDTITSYDGIATDFAKSDMDVAKSLGRYSESTIYEAGADGYKEVGPSLMSSKPNVTLADAKMTESVSIDTSKGNWFNDWLYGNKAKSDKAMAHKYGDWKKYADQGYETGGEMMWQNLKAFGSGLIDPRAVGTFKSMYSSQGSMDKYLKEQRKANSV